MSLFERIEEFSLQEDTFGALDLQGDLLNGDLGSALGELNFDLGQDGGLKPHQSHQTSLESLAIPSAAEDSFGEDWMETVDLSSLLNGNLNVPPAVEVSDPEPEPEPRKEGLKPLAFEILKQLLTCPVPDNKVETTKTEESLPNSPEQQVVDYFTHTLVDTNFDLLVGNEVSSNCLEDLIEIKPDESENLQQNENSSDSTEAEVIVSWVSPHSIQSNDSFTSCPTSPESVSFQTIDSSHLGDSSDSFSQVSENDFTEPKAVSKRSKKLSKKAAPYEIDSPVHDKSTRKKVQNKNAATRYRVKKRMEKATLQEQEGQLSDRNKELREKVESLQREISYMKELMAEIQKAKLKKI